MQKFKEKLKNSPKDASQVFCSETCQLNKEETLSVDGIVLSLNNPDENQVQQTERPLKSKVFVLNLQGKPLMPCSYAKSKRMVKKGAAKVVKRFPFTIQLNFACENVIQDVFLGIDTGYGNIGFSAVSEKSELICGTLKLDGKTKERLDERRMYRRGRRSRHHWYRKPRFLNRVSTKKKGWLPPSIERIYQTHLTLIEKIKKILPITKVIVEVAKFDIQKLENPEVVGTDYQQGSMYEYQNIRSYLMSREKGLCEHCKKDFKNNPSHIHHRKQKSKDGNNRLGNLMLVHEKCHKEIHKKPELLKKYQVALTKNYKHSTFMSIINKKLYEDVENLEVTFGNITFVNRNNLGLEKTHYNDAFVIAKGNNQERTRPVEIIQKHRNNRTLQLNRKGFKPSIRKKKYKFQPKDLVKIKDSIFEVKGIHSYGRQIKLKGLLNNIINIAIKKLDDFVFYQGTLKWSW